EDVESYSNSRIIDLSYRMGLLTRAEWRRLKRCYEIRRDLEHEDDEYEAELEDCVYIFKTCIEVVLSRDPVELLRVSDVKEVIENPKPQFPEQQFLDDYSGAPEPRQLEIQRFLVSTSLDPDRPDIVRCNAVEMLKHLASDTKNPVKIDVAHDLHKRIGRGVPDIAIFKVAHAAGVAPYLKKNKRNDYFSDVFKRLRSAEHVWKKHAEHGDLLAELEDVGGLEYCECDETGRKILGWLILCYVGEPGGYGDWGRRRAVFFSDTAAPIIQRIIQRSGEREVRLLKEAAKFKTVKRALAQGKSIAQRFEDLLDLAGDV
ncbi:MAG: hypothetical protein MI757_21145, partial [Pirellulales bacterium]|nr:hypothetical protein [Pirellulales bacterium]